MPFVCKICQQCPTSHSFVKLEEHIDRDVYYTCPINATNNETTGIIQHYDGVLSELNGKNWIWILDLKGFKMKNFLEIKNAVALAKLITEKYSTHLEKIMIINANGYTSTIYELVKPFLNKRVKSIITFSNEQSESNVALSSSF